MSDRPLAITATGMVTGVGLDTYSSCAAIRAAIDNFQETQFIDDGGEKLMGCQVSLGEAWRGTRKLAKMLASTLTECAKQRGLSLQQVPVLICLAEPDRPGQLPNHGNRVYFETEQELGFAFHPESRVIKQGRVGSLLALKLAREMIYEDKLQHVIIAGVDSLLSASALRHFEQSARLLTSKHSDGFIPGEAAAAILVQAPEAKQISQLLCLGLGFGQELATIDSEQPLRADGLVTAIKESLADANRKMEDLDFRIVDVSGEQYWFKETSLALLRTLHIPQPEFDIWHPTDCIGEVGAAIGLINLAVIKVAAEKGYAKGHQVLAHISNWDSQRAAAVLSYSKWEC
ncbi:3-oxoacyl-ACP synthase [Bowmanella denitrificans]|uniref:3-oxoacyl-ACP synthase n=1 Tax=Bowmanella denitrificans TaxID=366582 RepID=A0ABN0X9Y1_9ALTE